MGIVKYQTLMAGLMCMALGGCSSMGWGDNSNSNRNSSSGSSGSGASSGGAGMSSPAPADPAKGNPAVDSGPATTNNSDGMATPPTPSSSGSPGTTMAPGGTAPADTAPSAGSSMAAPAAGADAGAMALYGVVQAIDPMPRAQALGGAPASTSGATDTSGTSGMAATGAGGANDMVYRITLKLDDGSMRAFMQESQPSVQVGDRVRIANGTMQRN